MAAIDEHDMTPREVIRNLLTAARQTAEGKIPSLDATISQIARAQEHVETLPEEQRNEVYEALLPDRTTPLDPQRPTRDLLEHLLDGIRAANALFRSYVDEVEGVPTIDDEPFSTPTASSGSSRTRTSPTPTTATHGTKRSTGRSSIKCGKKRRPRASDCHRRT